MLEEDDPETGRLVRRIGEDILANKPAGSLTVSVSIPDVIISHLRHRFTKITSVMSWY